MPVSAPVQGVDLIRRTPGCKIPACIFQNVSVTRQKLGRCSKLRETTKCSSWLLLFFILENTFRLMTSYQIYGWEIISIWISRFWSLYYYCVKRTPCFEKMYACCLGKSCLQITFERLTYLFEIVTQRMTGIFWLPVHSSNDQGCAKPKPEATNLSQVPHRGCKDLKSWAICHCYIPGCWGS